MFELKIITNVHISVKKKILNTVYINNNDNLHFFEI